MILREYFSFDDTVYSEQFNTLLLLNDMIQVKELGYCPEFHILGGTALLLHDILSIVTIDIDVANKLPDEIKEIVEPFVSDNASEVSLLPTNYITRLCNYRVEVFTHMRVRLLSLEDLFITKLWSWRTKDKDDLSLLYKSNRLNHSLLIHILSNEICYKYRNVLFKRLNIIKEVVE